MKTIATLLVIGSVMGSMPAHAKGAGHSKSSGGRSYGFHSVSPGTGSKASSTRVDRYTKKNGTTVDSYRRTTADKNFRNNYSTKGNENLTTGKEGTRVTEPSK